MNRRLPRVVILRPAIAASLWISLLCGFAVAKADEVDSQRTSSSIRRAVAAAYQKRQALRLEYRLTSSSMGTVPAGQSIQREMAADRHGRFFLDNGHVHETMSLADDPYRKISFVSPAGTEILILLDRVVERHPAPVPIGFLQGLPDELVLLLGWWPFLDAPEREILGRKQSIEALVNDHSYILRPQPEDVGGAECDVIEIPNVDAVWVDSKNGSVIRRRRIFDSETAALAAEIEYRDFRTIGSDLQAPMTIGILDFDFAAETAAKREQCLNRIEIQVLKATSNEDVEISAPNLPPGTIQRSRNDEYELIAPGEEVHARSMAIWGRKQFASPAEPEPSGLRSQSDPLLLFGVAGLAVGCLFLTWRFRLSGRDA